MLTSLFETALSLLTYMSTWTASRGWAAQRMPDSSFRVSCHFKCCGG